MQDIHMPGMPGMSHAFSLNLPMNRNGSGTSWLPDHSPMYGKMIHGKKWTYMLHGNLFLRYNNQDISNSNERGGEKFDIPAWLMWMGQRNTGKNQLLHFSTMFSLDALSANSGYPLLFQSGESYKGTALVDKQHPHDLFSELALSYTYAFSKQTEIFVYLGLPGEPALGPVAFMHRPSALVNPDAPISHHWIDATHITFGVSTLGFRWKNFKLEGSVFSGREPDEHRFNIDQPHLNSYSGRLSYNPNTNWALQVSHGFIKSPEALHPEEDIKRSTASAIWSKKDWNTAIIWGMNQIKDHVAEHAFTLEGAWQKQKITFFGRYDFVQKSAEELVLGAGFTTDDLFNIHAISLGFNYQLFTARSGNIAIGSHLTYYQSSTGLQGIYGKHPMAFEAYLRLYPKLMSH